MGVHYFIECAHDGCSEKVEDWDEGTVGIARRAHDDGWRALRERGPREHLTNYCPGHVTPYMGPVLGALSLYDTALMLEERLASANARIGRTKGYLRQALDALIALQKDTT